MATALAQRAKSAEHRPAIKRRTYDGDDVVAGDLFSGFGGLTRGMEMAGVTTILAANHNRYKVEIHEANHPGAEHWICDLADPESGDYHSPRDLPKVDWLAAGVSCVHHSGANAQRAYQQSRSLFDFEDADYEARVTRSERDRATAVCVLQYAEIHHPKIILVECTTELTSWGKALPGKRTIGDGRTYRWWLKEMCNLGYKTKSLYLNSMFFEVPQSRDRIYICFWDQALRDPDLEHRPLAWCESCDEVVESVWAWRKNGIPPSGRVRWGEQYVYRCPRCTNAVVPPRAPAINALDFTDLGTKIGDRTRPLAASSMARVQRCIERFKDFPAVLMPVKSIRGVDRHPWQPMGTQTSQQETALLSTGALATVAGNTFEREGSECRTRTLDEPLWTQHATNGVALVTPPAAAVVPYRSGTNPTLASEPMPTQGSLESMAVVSATLPLRSHGTPSSLDEPMATVVGGAGSGGISLVSAGVIPYRQHTIPTTHAEPMPSFTADQLPGVLAAGIINANGGEDEAKYRSRPVSDPFGGFTSIPATQLLTAAFFKQNGGADDTSPHGVGDPLGTLTSRDTTGLAIAEWHQMLDGLTPEDCYFRMMFAHEVRDGCGFDTDFIVWGSTRDQIDGYGNAVSPPVGAWISLRLKDIL